MTKINNLVRELKENTEDYEFYPTSKEMIKPIFDDITESHLKILDIGCGTCNFKKFYEELEKERYYKENPDESDYGFTGNNSGYSVSKKYISKYYVIEKSKTLIDNLEKDIIVLGTDFHTDMLIDKPVDVIFCNPPYSEFKDWTIKIIQEGNCYDIYLIIPKRWKEDKDIKKLLEKKNITPVILGEFDFLNAERQARAKVDILHIPKKTREHYNSKLEPIETTAFDEWFDDTFKMSDREEKEINSWEKDKHEKEKIKNKLICEPQDKAKVLIQFYEEELNTLFEHFKAICSLDVDILETIGISKNAVKEAIKQKMINLKNIYWEMVFDEMEEITNRLTTSSRSNMLERFTELKSVDFTLKNIYSLIIWVIKNANTYYDDQLIEFYKSLSSKENVKPYKSNIKLFEKENWRYNSFNQKATHYTLDYRIICSSRIIMGVGTSWGGDFEGGYKHLEKVSDFKAIFNNLGFEVSYIEECRSFGDKYYAYDKEDKELFEYKCFKNGNLHIKLNIEFTKAMNVEVSRLLGWIKSKEDIKKEFCKEMAEGAEKYFKVNKYIPISSNIPLLNEEMIERAKRGDED